MAEQNSLVEHLRVLAEDNYSVKQKFIDQCGEQFSLLLEKIAEIFESGHRLYICGNGGSAGDAQHLATELVVRLDASQKRDPLPAIALTTDTSILTATANDFGFEYIFSRQIEALGRPGDGLLILSTSGNSDNLVPAANKAHELHLPVLALLGKGGGRVLELADLAVVIPSQNTQRIQETHLFCLHALCEFLEERFAP
jgi:D-sedoheptulose 7-phosphate isomerase